MGIKSKSIMISSLAFGSIVCGKFIYHERKLWANLSTDIISIGQKGTKKAVVVGMCKLCRMPVKMHNYIIAKTINE